MKEIYQFNQLHKEFHRCQSPSSGKRLRDFLYQKENMKVLSSYAMHNPHPNMHEKFFFDCEAAITAIDSWMVQRAQIDVSFRFIDDLKPMIAS